MSAPKFGGQDALTLDFDIEVRPIAWFGGDWVTKQPTAIAWKYVDDDFGALLRPHVAVIGESFDTRKTLDEERRMLEEFVRAYDKADIVTGHFIRGFDLPTLNAALMRLDLPLLEPKHTVDTKLDLVKASGISKSQENLGAMYELEHPKIPMNTATWMAGNLLLPHGIAATKKRVVGDVEQHIELLAEMRRRGHVGSGKAWSPKAGNGKSYSP